MRRRRRRRRRRTNGKLKCGEGGGNTRAGAPFMAKAAFLFDSWTLMRVHRLHMLSRSAYAAGSMDNADIRRTT
jgi:hypothetical protein